MSQPSDESPFHAQPPVSEKPIIVDEPSLLELESVVAPQSPMVLMQTARDLVARQQLGEAKRVLRVMLAQSPHSAEALSLLGTIDLLNDQPRAALPRLAHAADLEPTWSEVRRLCGEAAYRTGQTDMAAMYFKAALKLKPNWPEVTTRLGEALLRMGELKEGWANYESRWQIPSYRKTAPPIHVAMWDGSQPLPRKSIIVFAEQGLNEIFQFVRYAELLRKRGAKVIVTCPVDLRTLIETVPGVGRAIGFGEPLLPADYQVPMMSLPHLIGTVLGTIPAPVKYLTADSGIARPWREHLTKLSPDKRRVGVVWTGYPGESLPPAATISLEALRPLWDVPDTTFFSLALGDAAAEIKTRSAPLVDLSPLLDSADTFAAVISELDAVIAVDTAVAHIAGALGKPVHVLLNSACHFRWTGVSAAAPWYPSAVLYRQEQEGDWTVPVARLFRDLGGRPPSDPFDAAY